MDQENLALRITFQLKSVSAAVSPDKSPLKLAFRLSLGELTCFRVTAIVPVKSTVVILMLKVFLLLFQSKLPKNGPIVVLALAATMRRPTLYPTVAPVPVGARVTNTLACRCDQQLGLSTTVIVAIHLQIAFA